MALHTDWDIRKGDKHCERCQKEFREEEEYFAGLYDENRQFVRRDFCLTCWEAVEKPSLYSFWRTRVPKKEEKAKLLVDDDIILNFFFRLENEQDQLKKNFRYVLALLLMRKKILKFKDVRRGEGGEALVLRQPKEGREFVVYNPQLTEEQIQKVTEEVGQILNVQV